MSPLNFQCVRKRNVSNLHLATLLIHVGSFFADRFAHLAYLRSFASERRKNVALAANDDDANTDARFSASAAYKSVSVRIFSLVRFWTLTSDFIHRKIMRPFLILGEFPSAKNQDLKQP